MAREVLGPCLRAAVGLLAWALAAVGATSASAQMITTDLDAGPPDAAAVAVTLAWSQPARVQVEQPAGELVLRTDRPIDHAAFAVLAPRITRWVVGVFLGYDSVVFKLAPATAVRVDVASTAVVVRLSQAGAPENGDLPTPDPSDAAARRRLRLLKAALLWSSGDAWEASRSLAQLAQDRPNDPEILAALGVVETRLGRWRQASAYLDAAAARQPQAGAPGTTRRGHLPVRGSEHAPRAQVQWLRDDQDGAIQRDGLRAGGHAFLAPGLRVSLDAESAWLRGVPGSAVASLPGGAADPAWLVAAGVRHDATSGSWLAAQASGADSAAGATAQGELWDRWGATRLTLAWREPRWDLPVLIGLAATRDAVGLQRTWRSAGSLGRPLRGDLDARVTAEFERWGVPHADATRTDVALAGTVQYVSWRSRPRVVLAYAVQHRSILEPGRAATDPELATALPRAHVHTATVATQLPVWQWLNVDALAGYGASLWGPDAAQLGAGLAWQPPSGVHAALRYQRGLAAASSTATLTTWTALAGIRF